MLPGTRRAKGHPTASTARALLVGAAVLLGACTSGRDKLLADLQSARPEERALAVKKLAESGNPDDLVLFTQAAKDPVSIVRGEALTALGKSQDTRVVDLLGEGLEDSDEFVQSRAAGALASIKNEKARAYLSLQYGRQGRSTRLAIVQGLKAANVPGAMATVIAAEAKSIWERNLKALEEGALPERVGAAEELGRSGRPDAVNKLVPLVKDQQVMLAAAAIRGLGLAADPRAVSTIADALAENDPEIRGAACDALAQLKDPQVLPRLRDVALEKSPTSPLATRALVALPRTPETDKALCEIVLGGAEREAQLAGHELRARGGCPLEALAPKLAAPATAAQALQAVAALGSLAKDLAPKVVPYLTNSDQRLKLAAVDALAEIGDPGFGPVVLKAWDAELKSLEVLRADWVKGPLPKQFAPGFDPAAPTLPDDPDAELKKKQADLLARVDALRNARAADAGRVLIEVTPPNEIVDDATDDQLKVLTALVRALGRLKVEGALEKLSGFVVDGSPPLRTAALAALASLGPAGLERAKEGLLDADRAVMGVVAQALADAGPDAQLLLIDAVGKRSSERTRLLEPLAGTVLPPSTTQQLIALVVEGGPEAGPAALLLADQGAKEAVAPMLKLLDDPTLAARREILKAIGKLKKPEAAEKVARDLYHDSPEVRAAAAEALGALPAGDNLDALDALKGDYYRKVREAAAAALSKLGAEQKR